MRTLTRYLGREVLAATMIIFLALASLFAFFDLINELGDVGKGGYTIGGALTFVALHLPARAYELFPVSALIGTLFAISQLVGNSEYTVMRVSGASLFQVGWAVVRVGIPLALVNCSRANSSRRQPSVLRRRFAQPPEAMPRASSRNSSIPASGSRRT